MSLKTVMASAAAVAAMAASAVVCVVAGAFALYAVLRGWLTPAGAAAVVAGAFAVLMLLLAMLLGRKAHPYEHVPEQDDGLVARLLVLAKERPLMAAGVGVAAAAVMVRNPKLIATLLSVALASRAAKPER